MPATIDYSSEDTVSDIFTASNFTDDLHKYLGLDPAIASQHQPIDVDALLHSCIHILEQDQFRFILTKNVTLKLPPWAIDARDSRLYLPYGTVSSLTTFTYLNQDGTTDNADSTYYTLFSERDSFIWSDNWSSALPSLERNNPLPITVTYTTGYATFAEIPRSTLHALKILCYHHFTAERSDRDIPTPCAYLHHMALDQHSNRRCHEFL